MWAKIQILIYYCTVYNTHWENRPAGEWKNKEYLGLKKCRVFIVIAGIKRQSQMSVKTKWDMPELSICQTKHRQWSVLTKAWLAWTGLWKVALAARRGRLRFSRSLAFFYGVDNNSTEDKFIRKILPMEREFHRVFGILASEVAWNGGRFWCLPDSLGGNPSWQSVQWLAAKVTIRYLFHNTNSRDNSGSLFLTTHALQYTSLPHFYLPRLSGSIDVYGSNINR